MPFSPDSQMKYQMLFAVTCSFAGRGWNHNYQDSSATAESWHSERQRSWSAFLTSTAYKHGRPWIPKKAGPMENMTVQVIYEGSVLKGKPTREQGKQYKKSIQSQARAQFQVKSWPRPNPTGVLACKLHWQVCAALKLRESSIFLLLSHWRGSQGEALNSGVLLSRSIWMT